MWLEGFDIWVYVWNRGRWERIGEGWLEYTHRLFFYVGLP